MSMKWVGSPNHNIHLTQVRNQENLLPKWLWDPACQCQVGVAFIWLLETVEVLKHYIYVQKIPAMSMNWVACLNHNLQHDASENPSESPTATTPLWVRSVWGHKPKYKVLKHFLYVWRRPPMSMKCMRWLNHNLQYDASKKPSELPTTTTLRFHRADMLELHAYDH
jgi:hypothetical protein